MNGLFDLRTLFLIGSLASGICALTLYTSRRIHRPSGSALAWGALAQLLTSLAMFAIALRGLIPDWLSVVFGNAAGPAGMVVLYESIRRLCQVRPQPAYAVITITAVLGIQVALGSGHEQMDTRLQITSVVQGGFAALMLPLLRRRLNVDPRAPILCAIALAGFFLAIHLARLIWVAVHGTQATADGLYAAGPVQAGVAALFALLPMMHAMVMMSLVNGRLAADLRRIAITDDLTGLSTRRHFFARARERLGREAGAVGLLMLDLDWFKQVNDRYGHKIGDRVLIHFACLLRRSLARGDLAARYGGEEFCALFDRESEEKLRQAAQQLCDDVRNNPFEEGALTIPITVSIGLAIAREGDSVEALVSIADRRVYLAKAMGRDRLVDRKSAMAGPPPGVDLMQPLPAAVV